ncbi:MAG: YeeE/YedE thiosulfate transporter family protein [Pseudomonadota bacterium]
MSESVLAAKFKEGYSALFERNWPLWVGAVLIALLGILAAATGRPWGVAGGLRVWGDWLLYGVGLAAHPASHLFLSDASVLTWGLLLGAFGSALLSHQVAWTMAPPWELGKGLVGGVLLGIGSGLAGGCNVGGFYSALAASSVSGFAMLLGLIAGAILGLKYLLWEIEHIPSKAVKSRDKTAGGLDWNKIQPWLGGVFFLALILVAYGLSFGAYTSTGLLLVISASIGLVIQRCRFCFVRAFRDPFMTGEAVATKAVAISTMICLLGILLLKWTGALPESSYVYHHWLGGLLGGLIFGFGMLLTGGCGSGSVWRAGEGQVKLILAVIMFAVSNSLFKAHVFTNQVAASWGKPLFLPQTTGYFWAIVITCAVMIAWWTLAAWNEETDKLTLV